MACSWVNNGSLTDIQVSEAHHWPMVRAYADQRGLVETINRGVPTEMEVDPGTIVGGGVMDTLSGRRPLYHLASFFEPGDRTGGLGRDVPASALNETNVARVRMRGYPAGTAKVYSAFSLNAVKHDDMACRCGHDETTSVSVSGDDQDAEQSQAVTLNHGDSQDHRPDLKQLVVSMCCVGGNMPWLSTLEEGHASDKPLNHERLNRVAQQMADHAVLDQRLIDVADSAMVTADNGLTLGDQSFITRRPATDDACHPAIQTAVQENTGTLLGPFSQTRPTPNRPAAHDRASEPVVTGYGRDYRAMVIHSSAHDKRRQKALDKQMMKSETEQRQRAKRRQKKTFDGQADAEAAAQEAMKTKTTYHPLQIVVAERPQYARGRRQKEGTKTLKARPDGLQVTGLENQPWIEPAREEAGGFVLLTPIPDTDHHDALSAREVGVHDKEQHGIEKNFGFLKDDQIVHAGFLKKSEHIEAIGLIVMISLLIWRFMAYQMQKSIQAQDGHVPGWDNKPTQRPTASMVTIQFKGLWVIRQGSHRQLARPLSDAQLAFLAILRLDSDVFISSGNSS